MRQHETKRMLLNLAPQDQNGNRSAGGFVPLCAIFSPGLFDDASSSALKIIQHIESNVFLFAWAGKGLAQMEKPANGGLIH
jgi:hypothetical protein